MARLIWIAGLCCLALAAPQLRAQEESTGLSLYSGPSSPQHLEAAAILRGLRVAGADEARALTQLERVAQHDLSVLLDLLVLQRVPETGPADAPQVLSEPQRRLVLAALCKLPQAQVRVELSARLQSTEPNPGLPLALVRVLGAIGRGTDLPALAKWAPRKAQADTSTPAPLTREGKAAVIQATAGILGRDRFAWRELAQLLESCDEALARAMLSAVGEVGDARGVQLLHRTATKHANLASQAVALLRKLGPSTDAELDAAFTRWMSAQLPEARVEYARMLLQGMAVLDHGTWFEVYIEYLGHEEPALREAAHAALRKQSGLGLPLDVEAWQRWHAQELEWMKHQLPQLREDLVHEQSPRVVAALQAYSQRRLFLDALAQDVAIVLQDPRPALRILACKILEQWGLPSTVPALQRCLEDSDPQVVQAARTALEKLGYVPQN